MIVSRLKGGLGNFLFQISSGYSLALDNNVEYAVDLSRIWVVHSEWNTYKNNIFRNVPVIDKADGFGLYFYDSLKYKPMPYLHNHVYDGYFQCDKYFDHHRDKLLKLFAIDESTMEYLSEKYNDVINDDNTCSIHVRRGNFLKIDLFNKIDMSYYNKAIETIGSDKHFIIFSDDIQWCKSNFKNINATFIDDEQDYIDLYLMSLCKDNITTNSTFSWWGSYLNRNINNKIITPNKWFSHTHSSSDLIPDEWIKI